MSVILFPRGQLTQTDQDRMAAVGIVAVEVDDPSKVVAAPVAAGLIPADDFLYAALRGCDAHTYGREVLTKTLLAITEKRRATPSHNSTEEK